MGQWSAGLIAEDVGQFLQPDLDDLGVLAVRGKARRVSPCLLPAGLGLFLLLKLSGLRWRAMKQ